MLPDPGKKINNIHKTITNVSFRKLCLPYNVLLQRECPHVHILHKTTNWTEGSGRG